MKANAGTGPSGIELIEESIALLRRVPAGAWTVYYAGSGAFAVALVYFWAHTSWFRPDTSSVAVSALGLAFLFAAMKVAHAVFCAEVLALRQGAPAEAWTWRRVLRTAQVQLRLQVTGFVVLPMAVVLTYPAGYAYAFYQNLSVMGDAEDAFDVSWRQCLLAPGQNHVGLLLISGSILAITVNIAVGVLAIPWSARRFLGMGDLPAFTGAWFLNSTFFVIVVALTWLAVDPLIKAFYTLRVFYGRSRSTGEDLRLALRGARQGNAGGRAAARAATVLAVLLLALSAPESDAAETPPVGPAVTAAQTSPSAIDGENLDRALDSVLAGSAYRWQLRPKTGPSLGGGAIRSFLRTAGEMVVHAARSVVRAADAVARFFRKLFPSSSSGAERGRGGSVVPILLYAFAGLALIGLMYVVSIIWIRSREIAGQTARAVPAAPVVPDLVDERTSAAELPVDGWLALAREQAGLGEWRLALRALHLASLARLSGEGVLTLARFKTNLDYLREVRRRAPTRPSVASWFAARSTRYEEAWYGRGLAGEGEVRAWMRELEDPATIGGPGS